MHESAVRVHHEYSLISDEDVYLFNEGSHFRLFDKLGAHPLSVDGKQGVYFSVWAPNAERVSLIGDFNGWDGTQHPLQPRNESGLWEGFVNGIGEGLHYKFRI
jgi:1,4-alpha-glucan branching enzyme